jgi:FAD/FMN-containing dehydrogenase
MMRISSLAFLHVIFGAAFASNTTGSAACEILASVLPDRVFYPEATIYGASISSYPFLQLRLHPSCIFRPTSASEVSTAISILKESNRTRFAIKGGGHNANAGFNNVENGVTIDMQSMKTVEVARGDQVVRVGAGALSQDAYDAAEKRNLTVLAGRIGVVGVAGFLTGGMWITSRPCLMYAVRSLTNNRTGGVSFFSPQYGWACDAVVNFEIVLASGEIANANATSNSDLFAALKGGQNNFAVITRFDLKAFPARRIWGGRIVYAPAAVPELLTAFTDFKSAESYDPYVAGWMTIRYNHSAALFNPVVIMWHTKPELKPGGLKKITEVQPQVLNGMVEAPISEHTRNASRAVLAVQRR